MDAMRRIDSDFRLNLFADSAMDAEITARVQRIYAQKDSGSVKPSVMWWSSELLRPMT